MNNYNETFKKIKTAVEEKIAYAEREIAYLELQLKIMNNNSEFFVLKKDGTQYAIDLNKKPQSKNPLIRLKEHYDLKKMRKMQEYVIEEDTDILNTTKESVRILSYVNRYLSQYDLVSPVDSISIYMIHINVLRLFVDVTIEDFKNVLIACIRKNYEQYINNPTKITDTLASKDEHKMNEMKCCLILGKYFNKKGAMLPGDIEIFEATFNKLFNPENLLDEHLQAFLASQNLLSLNDVLDTLVLELQKQNLLALMAENKKAEYLKQKQEEAQVKHQEQKQQRKNLKDQKDALAKLNEYYQNGQFIKLPTDLTEFTDLLTKCLLDQTQEAKINRQLTEVLQKNQEQALLQKYLSDIDIAILKEAKQANQEALNYFLSAIDEIISLLEETQNEEDYNTLMQYLNENINNIKYSLTKNTPKQPTLKPQV